MNDFFVNLVARNLGTCDTVKPRTLGRFEADHPKMESSAVNEITNSTAIERNQSLQPPEEALHNIQDSIVPEGNQRVSNVPPEKSRMQLQEVGFVNTSVEPSSNGEVNEKQNNTPAPGKSQRIEPQISLGVDEQQVPHSDDHVLPRFESDIHSSEKAEYTPPEPYQQILPTRKTVESEMGVFVEREVQPTLTNVQEVANFDENLPRPPASGEYDLETGLNHRIRTMLVRLAGEPVSPNIVTTEGEKGTQRHERQLLIENQIATAPETAGSLSDAAIPPLDLIPASRQKVPREERNLPDDRGDASLYDGLDVPPWLSGIAPKFNDHVMEKEAKPEPVINVTIGRVEVKAVQAKTSTVAERPKKPTRTVMTLDEYLKQREGRGTR